MNSCYLFFINIGVCVCGVGGVFCGSCFLCFLMGLLCNMHELEHIELIKSIERHIFTLEHKSLSSCKSFYVQI